MTMTMTVAVHPCMGDTTGSPKGRVLRLQVPPSRPAVAGGEG